jgi:hypothetical protein
VFKEFYFLVNHMTVYKRNNTEREEVVQKLIMATSSKTGRKPS